MIKPYLAVAVQCGYPIITKREEIESVSIPHIKRALNVALPVCSWELPVRLVALPEGVLEGFTAEWTLEHTRFCREMAVEVPGKETDMLGELAKKHNVYLMGCVKAVDPDIIKDRYFNVAFLIDPSGEVILKHYKLQVVSGSHSITPHDVWDAYTAKYGDGLESFFQVADTDIGRIGLSICMEGYFPDIYRAYAMLGAEIVYRPSSTDPRVSQGSWEISNRARALDNNCYMVCPNTAPANSSTAFKAAGGRSMIVDYRGQVLNKVLYNGEGYACGLLNIEELRDHRERAVSVNWLPGLATECYRKIYDTPIYPKNLWLHESPGYSRERLKFNRFFESVGELQKRGVFQKPAN